LSNRDKARVRERAAQGLASRKELLDAENAAYHGPGTCTFYGTANSNQMLLEAMGLHVPGAAFVHPHDGRREHLTREAVGLVLQRVLAGAQFLPIGRLVDERAIVNAMAALLATGGSTNHLIHWVAVARAACIVIDWSDFAELSEVVPLIARVYPNGDADVNDFEAAGGPRAVMGELLGAGLMHADAAAMAPEGITAHGFAQDRQSGGGGRLPPDGPVIRPVVSPFAPTGGLKLLQGNLGRAVIKVSAVPSSHHVIEAPARVFDSQQALLAAFAAGELDGDVVAVVRFQGPRANGMPELHKLTPPLAVLQDRGHRVALVTDGRMSGASGKVPAAIHVTPEALDGGALALVCDGDRIRVDALQGQLQLLVGPQELARRIAAVRCESQALDSGHGLGRELFAGLRRNVRGAEEGAISWL
jgi:phosphogluconate dehydratase